VNAQITATPRSRRAGQGAEILGQLAEAGVNLVAFSGFPIGGGKVQLDFVAKKAWELCEEC